MTVARDLRGEVRVRSMFDRIAGRYDLMNSVMSAGLHHRWRERAVQLARPPVGGAAPHGCCGTGGFGVALQRAGGPGGGGGGPDLSEAVVGIAPPESARVGAW